MHQIDCNGRIATINYEPRWAHQIVPEPEPEPESKPIGNLRNRVSRKHWVAYLRTYGKITAKEPADMEPQGMVPFGMYPKHNPKPKREPK